MKRLYVRLCAWGEASCKRQRQLLSGASSQQYIYRAREPTVARLSQMSAFS